jgi:hypothetical protein
MLALRLRRDGAAQISTPLLPARPTALYPVVLTALVVASVSEMLFLRVVSRVGVHIPKEEPILTVYRWLTAYGDFAFNVAVLLAASAAGLLVYRLASEYRTSFVGSALLPALIAALLIGAAFQAAAGSSEVPRLAFGVMSCAALLATLCLAWPSAAVGPRVRLVMTLMVSGLLLGQYHVLGQITLQAAGSTASLPLGTAALGLAEALVLLAGMAVFWAWFPWRERMTSHRIELGAASLASMVLVGAFLREPSTTSILSLWTSGITMYLPFPLYVASFWLYIATAAYAVRRPELRPIGFALLLIFAAGLLLETTYQHLLAIVALTLVAEAPGQSGVREAQ